MNQLLGFFLLCFSVQSFAQQSPIHVPMKLQSSNIGSIEEPQQEDQAATYFYMPVGKEPNSGISYFQYLQILEYFTRLYPQIQFPVEWVEPYFAAFAKKINTTRSVHLWGGLVRMPTATLPVVITAVCHEIGHHLGGEPLQDQVHGGEWASAEGQADYFAARYCLPRTKFDHPEWFETLNSDYKNLRSDNIVIQNCLQNHFCRTSVLSAYQMFQVFSAMPQSEREYFQFDLIAPTAEKSIFQSYPSLQCRFETFVAGGSCFVDSQSVNCQRPSCWYRKETQ